MIRLSPVLAALCLVLLPATGCSDGGGGSASDTADSATTGGDTTDSESGSTGEMACISGEPVTKSGTNLMENFGAPCTSNADCEAILGPGGECFTNVLDLYDAPGGYCSIKCTLPADNETKYSPDDAACSMDGGITCFGLNGFFEACAPECQSEEDCQREGYVCRLMPQIAMEGEPKFCLMPDICGPDLGE